jgi:hypothetical protein
MVVKEVAEGGEDNPLKGAAELTKDKVDDLKATVGM